ncbi:MAG TPA: sulfite reductase subunit alpha [Candidatus Didemnitutus sp.]|nr:sulfite reductase subunit alpha [Candidatus Didemnitutus sp.]
MDGIPCIPDSAPFTPEQRQWLNGYFAGLFSRVPASSSPAAMPPPAVAAIPLTVLFGSQTGTSEALARRAAKSAGQRGFQATTADLGQVTLARLEKEKNVLLLTSTYGEGEPPDNAKALHAALKKATEGSETPLQQLAFSVCAFGDSNYVKFCQAGRDFDGFLEKLGGRRVSPRVECDLDYESRFASWLDAALAALNKGNPADTAATLPAVSVAAVSAPEPAPAAAEYSKKNPFLTPVRMVRRLNAIGSAKEVHHIEFSLEGSGLGYEPGDALGVVPQNCPRLVTEVLAALDCDGEEEVPAPEGGSISLRRALTEHYDLGRPSVKLLKLFPVLAGAGDDSIAASGHHHVVDMLVAARSSDDHRVPPAELVGALRRLQPRLYSISSSPAAHAGRVHLTVGAVRYEVGGRARQGVCSTFLADRAAVAGPVGVFIHANNNFRLPVNPDAPVIMIGPGTGIAPFRAFLHERRMRGMRGRNWLFFGDQHEATDFLYRDELMSFQREGILPRLDLAWSRDSSAKVYVQHRMLENAKEIWAWLEEGAHLYVCGDGSRMAKDVDVALHRIVETAGGKSPEQAALYVSGLRSARAYQRDVY